MRRFCETIKKPCVANIVPGGKTPILSPKVLTEIGFKVALYPVALLMSSIAAMRKRLSEVQGDPNLPLPADMSFIELQELVGFPEYWDRETKYQVLG
jgi:2,3-dimethylmalate lyase